jgi:hypothetical protein
MMAGKNIKKIILMSFLLSFIFCAKNENKNINELCFIYIDKLKSTIKFKRADYMLHVKKDSSNHKYEVYRICMWTDLLNKDDLPNKIFSYDSIKIAFFTKKLRRKK